MKNIFIAGVFALTLTGCATIISGTTQTVSIKSFPSAATVYDNGQVIGKTPIWADLKRKKEHSIRIELEGYKPYEIEITRQFNAWYVGNILFGGLIGLVVDPITGAIYKLTPTQIQGDLESDNKAVIKKSSADIDVTVTLQSDAQGTLIGQLEREDK